MSQAANRLSKTWQSMVERESAQIRDAFLQSPEAPPASRSVLAYLLAAVVIALALAMLGVGLWLAFRTLGLVGHLNGFERVVSGFFAFLLLGMVWLARPTFPEMPGTAISAAEAPEFYALVGEVAQALGVAVPARITLLPYVNAFMGRSGFPPRPALGIGLPLWYAMHPQERVAILAHELAHERNNDPTRGGLIGFSLNLLAHMEYVMRPDYLFGGGIINLVPNLIQWMFSWIPLGLFRALLSLVGADQQRAEYRADLLSAEAAGTAATASALDKLHFSEVYESALHKQRHFPERPHAFLELRHIWDTMPQAEQQKRRDEYLERRVRLDDSHPPTVDRLKVVQAYQYAPKVTLTEERAARIDAELTPFVSRLEKDAYDAYREYYDNW